MSENKEEPEYKEESEKSNEERKKTIQDTTLEAVYKKIKSKKRGKQTPLGYRETFIMLEEWVESREDISSWEEITPDHIVLLDDYLSDEEGLYGSTVDRHMDRIRMLFRSDKVKDKGINKEKCIREINNLDNTNQQLYQKKTGKKVIFVTKDEYKKMLEAVESLREEIIIRILWECGLRRAELAETTLQKVDLDEMVIHVDNKKNPDTRDVPFSANLLSPLREWMEYGGREQYSKHNEDNYLIVTQHSSQVQPAYINKVVRRVADRAGVSESYGTDAKDRQLWKPTAHHFRNAYATYRASNGINLKKLARMMGHRSTDQTARYVGVITNDLKEANKDYRPKLKDTAREVAREL